MSKKPTLNAQEKSSTGQPREFSVILPAAVDDLVLIHRRRESKSGEAIISEPFSFENKDWQVWETCVRRIAFGHQNFGVEITKTGDEIYIGRKAYSFLLETVCGLQSPVRGETEVHGQFRKFLAGLEQKTWLREVMESVHVQARRVRAEYLKDLGSQSYGSLARRKLRECASIEILGSGQLVHEILPWLMKLEKPVRLYVRNLETAGWVNERYPSSQFQHLQVLPMSQGIENSSGLIVAAPMTRAEITRLIKGEPQMILDFRAESTRDPLITLTAPVLTLSGIFSEIEGTKGRVEDVVEKARQKIREIVGDDVENIGANQTLN